MLFTTIFVGIFITLLLFTIYIYKRQLTYLLKWFTYPAIILTLSVIAIPIFMINGPRKSTNILSFIPQLHMISKIIGVHWVITGHEHVNEVKGPCVVVANHQSALDFLCMCELWPIFHKCVGVAKKGLIWFIPFGPAAYLAGTVFIDRRQALSAKSTLTNVGENMKIEGNKVFMFPEGTRNKGAEFLPFKKGAFHIALQYKVPVLPVVIGPYHFINDEERWFGSGTVQVTILPPIQTTDYTLSDISELSNKARDVMSREFSRLSTIEHS